MYTEVEHKQSGQLLRRDAPLDLGGKGENFAPTDLFATALGTCFISVVGKMAKEKEWKLEEITVEIDKKMAIKWPLRSDEITLQILMPSNLTSEQLEILTETTKDYPVLRSISNPIKTMVNWIK